MCSQVPRGLFLSPLRDEGRVNAVLPRGLQVRRVTFALFLYSCICRNVIKTVPLNSSDRVSPLPFAPRSGFRTCCLRPLSARSGLVLARCAAACRIAASSSCSISKLHLWPLCCMMYVCRPVPPPLPPPPCQLTTTTNFAFCPHRSLLPTTRSDVYPLAAVSARVQFLGRY